MHFAFIHKLKLFLLFTLLGVKSVNAQTFQWAKHLGDAGPYGQCIATDVAGNVYLSGRAGASTDLDPGAGVIIPTAPAYIAKYTPAGNFVWAKSFGTGAVRVAAWDLTVDLAGNILLAGSFRGTTDFDPGPGVVNLIASSITQDGFLLKLSNTGNFLWVMEYDGGGFTDALSVVTDASNNVYVSGGFGGIMDVDPGAAVYNLTSAGAGDAFICKLSPAGAFIWGKRVGGADGDYAQSITIDAAGNVLVIGGFIGTVDFDPSGGVFNLAAPAAFYNVYVLKLTAAGNFSWARRIGGSGDQSSAMKVGTDATNNVYFAGLFQGTADFDPGSTAYNLTSAGLNDFFVCKLSSAGNFSWAKRMGGINDDRLNGMDIDSYGNVYTCGYFEGTVDFDPNAAVVTRTSSVTDIFIHKMNTSGNYAWVWTMGNSALTNDYNAADDLVLDGSNNLYTTGGFNNTVDFNDGAGTSNLTSAGATGIFIHKIQNTSPLPIELLSFNATQNKTAVDIAWKTATEINNDFFTVERSKDGNAFEEIGNISGAGNSNIILEYSFTDINPYNGISYYRLKQTDFNGEFSYSQSVAIRIVKNVGPLNVYYNHLDGNCFVNFTGNEDGIYNFLIFDSQGRIVKSEEISLQNGANSFKLNFVLLAKGIYIIELQSPFFEKLTAKVVVN